MRKGSKKPLVVPGDPTEFTLWVIRRRHDGAVFPPVKGQGKGGSHTEPTLNVFPRIFVSSVNASIFLGQWCKGIWRKTPESNLENESFLAEPVFVPGRNYNDFDIVPFTAYDPNRARIIDDMLSACENLVSQYESGRVNIKAAYIEVAWATQRWRAINERYRTSTPAPASDRRDQDDPETDRE